MGEDSAPSGDATETAQPPSNERILWIMAIVGLVGGVAGIAFSSLRFGLGVVIGTALAFANYFWLKRSLRKIFAAAESGEKPRMLAGKYFLRYVVIALIIFLLYAANVVPVVAVIAGLAAFGIAVVIDGSIRIFSKS